MASLSDQFMMYAILGYALAMLAYTAEYAFGARGLVARVAVRQRSLIGAGAPVDDAFDADVDSDASLDPSTDDDLVDEEVTSRSGLANPRLALLAGRAGVALTMLAWAVHLGAIITRGLAAHRVPWGNMYEFVLAVCFVGATAWLIVMLRRPSLRPLGLFATLALLILLGTDALRLYTPVGPLMPALNSYWLKIHVTAAITASGTFLVGFVTAALTQVKLGYDAGRRSFPFSLGDRIPAADGLERLTFRVHAFAFPIWTFAIMCGAIWAEAAWGRYWGWDPKETWSFIAWVIYAGYLHARATPSVKRSTATWLAIVGWAAMMINLFGVNLVISGLHSYAGVK
jgi:cytochrome c-type biogenesis protein CcsB